jgi:hypothetical protein
MDNKLTFNWRRSVLYARDGSGTFSLAQAAFTPGTTIETSKVNSDLSDIAAGLTQSVSKDGQTTYTASQPMGGFKLTGLGVGTGTGESIRYDEFKMAFRSHLAGLGMSSRTNTTITYGAGTWTESGQTQVFTNAGGTIDCATTGANGLDAGSLANSTWYHAYAIGKTDGTTSLLASTSASSPTMPSGYTLKRRIGSFKTNGSAQIIDMVQDDDIFQWLVPINDISATNQGTGAITRTLNVPTGVRVQAIISATVATNTDSGTALGLISDLSTTDTAPTVTLNNCGQHAAINTVSSLLQAPSFIRVFTNTSAQVRTRINNSAANTTLQIGTFGCVDRRGRND